MLTEFSQVADHLGGLNEDKIKVTARILSVTIENKYITPAA